MVPNFLTCRVDYKLVQPLNQGLWPYLREVEHVNPILCQCPPSVYLITDHTNDLTWIINLSSIYCIFDRVFVEIILLIKPHAVYNYVLDVCFVK